MIYSGLDWSGDVGLAREGDRLLVFALVHVDDSEMPNLASSLAAARKELRWDSRKPFKHQGASDRTHRVFFEAIRPLKIGARLLVIDRSRWDADWLERSGTDRLADGIVKVVLGCPDTIVEGHVLYIDCPRSELKVVGEYRTSIRKALRSAGRGSFKNVQPRADHRGDGQVIQIADMLAGEAREQGGISGPYLSCLSSKIAVEME